MTFEKAIEIMCSDSSEKEEAIQFLSKAIADNSQRGYWHDGPNSTNVSDWLEESDLDGSESLEDLVAEWDE